MFTDYLDNPIHVGDTITWPTCSGSSAADLNMGVVKEIREIIPYNPSDPADRLGYLHEDRLQEHPTARMIAGRWVTAPHLQNGYGDYLRDDSKAYMLRVEKHRGGADGRTVEKNKMVTLKNVDRVVVVTSLVS